MKKIISLLLVMLLVVVACPVFAAADNYVNIVSIENGASFTVGASIPLIAETNAEVAHIDFYANGIKIPGVATASGKAVVWTPDAAGSYSLSAKVTPVSGSVIETATAVNVTITRDSTDEWFLAKMDEASDVSLFNGNWGAPENKLTAAHANAEYTKISNYSAPWGPQSGVGMCQFKFDYGFNFTGYEYINIVAYVTEPYTSYVTMYLPTPSNPLYENSCLVDWKVGWNLVTIQFYDVTEPSNDLPKFKCWNQRNVKGIGFNSDGKFHGATDNQAFSSTRYAYVDSIFLSKSIPTAPVATPVVENGTTVANLTEYPISFNTAMDVDTLVAENVTVKDSEDHEIEVESVDKTAGAMVVKFAEDAFTAGETYTVALENAVTSAYGVTVANASWTFTAAETATPIAKVSYPANGTSLVSNGVVLAANVIGDASAVTFKNGDGAEIGAATKGVEGEWYYAANSMPAGDYTGVYATVTYAGGSVDTAAVDFTVTEALTYALSGIKNDEEITLDTSVVPLLSRTIGLTSTDGVAKVIYKVDGTPKATISSAPFAWDMPFTDVGVSHEVSASVYTAAGIVDTAAISYKTVYTTLSQRTGSDYSSDFSNATPGATVSEGKLTRNVNNRSGQYTLTYEDVTAFGGADNAIKITKVAASPSQGALLLFEPANMTLGSTSANPRVKWTFDVYMPENVTYTSNDLLTLRSDYNIANKTAVICDFSTLATGQWHSFEVYADLISDIITVNIDDTTAIYPISETLKTELTTNGQVRAGGKVTFEMYNDLYVDNFTTYRVLLDNAVSGAFVNGYNYDKDADGVNTTVSYVNMTSAPVDVNVYFALYNGENLVKAWFEPVTVASKEFKQISKDVAFAQANATGTTVKAFCWTPELQPIDSIR